jgi:valyl-tRNA synthetase
MSKQLGNSPDPIELMEQFGTDGVRMGLLMAAPAGNDLLFDDSLCEQGRNFSNKIWNAHRLIKGWEIKANTDAYYTKTADDIQRWMDNRIFKDIALIDDHFSKFRVSDAMMVIYKLIWGDFCSWYLEWMKPAYGDPIPQKQYNLVVATFDQLLRLAHPFMPFVTEHLWQQLEPRNGAFINEQSWPTGRRASNDMSFIQQGMELTTLVRSVRNAKGISPKIPAQLTIHTKNAKAYASAEISVDKLANISSFSYQNSGDGIKELLGTDEIFIAFEGIELAKKDKSGIASEIARLKGFLVGIDKKLSNEKFVANAADEVVEREQQKKADTLSKIQTLEKELEE